MTKTLMLSIIFVIGSMFTGVVNAHSGDKAGGTYMKCPDGKWKHNTVCSSKGGKDDHRHTCKKDGKDNYDTVSGSKGKTRVCKGSCYKSSYGC